MKLQKNILFILMFILISATSAAFAQDTVYVAAGPDSILAAFQKVNPGGTIILTTSGGVYSTSSFIGIGFTGTNDRNIEVTIKAKDGLAEKPVWTSSSNVVDIRGNCTIQGIKFDYTANPTHYPLYLKESGDTGTVKIEDCDLIGASNGLVGSGSAGDSLIFKNCTFSKISAYGVKLQKGKGTLGAVNYLGLEDCTFDSVYQAVLVQDNDGNISTPGPAIVMNHLTNYGSMGSPAFNITGIDGVILKNSIISNADSLVMDLYGTNSKVNNVLYYSSKGSFGYQDGATFLQLSNVLANQNPMFKDPANGDFTLQTGSPAIGAADDGTSLGDLRWVPPAPKLIEVTAGTDQILAAFQAIAPGGTIELATSGGVYQESDFIGIGYVNGANTRDIPVTIKAKDGLAKKPIWFTNTQNVLDIRRSCLIKGIDFDYTSNPTHYPLYVKENGDTGTVKIEDCDIINASNGLVGSGSAGDSLIFENCTFKNISAYGAKLQKGKGTLGAFNYVGLENCTFDSVYQAVLVQDNDGNISTPGPKIVLNHLTNYGSMGSPAFNITGIDGVTLKNSIVTNADSLVLDLYGTNTKVSNIMYYQSKGSFGYQDNATQSQLSSIFADEDPLFQNPASGDFTLQTGSPAIGAADDGSNLGDLSWSSPVVPVELTSFTAAADNNNVNLNWSTATETNNSGFEVERASSRLDGTMPRQDTWVKIGFIKGSGSSTESQSYSFVDKNLTPGNYTYRLKQIDFNGTFSYSKEVEVELNTPKTFALDQNYPNPFNPSTTIQFSIPKSGVYKIKVYDILGKEVETLFNGNIAPGIYKINFNADKLSSGLYIYTLTGNNVNIVRKMMLLK